MKPLISALLLLASCGTPDPRDSVVTGNPDLTVDLALIHYSGDVALSADAREVLVVALPGALAPSGGLLRVRHVASDVTSQPAVSSRGGFVASVSGARLGDSLEIAYSRDGEAARASFVLDDALDGIAAPTTGSLPLVPAPPASDGTVEVDLTVVSGSPPFVVFNRDNGAAAESVAGDTSLRLAAASFDSICIFSRDDTAASTVYCQRVP